MTTSSTIVKYVIVVSLYSLLQSHALAGQFYGGSISNTVEKQANGTHLVTIELITGWVLDNGPCGPGCNSSDIGRSTRSTRPLMTKTDPYFLGNYTYEFRNKTTGTYQVHNMNTVVLSTYNETVMAVSEFARWEQELLYFSFIMPPGVEKMTVNVDGKSWRHLTMQERAEKWNLQTRVSTALRSDTGKPNHSPRAFAKPYYRVELDKVTEVIIPAVDDDGDLVKCEMAAFVEGGLISRFPPPNVQVFENCTVSINAAMSSNYTDDSWIAVPVSVRDYNRETITYGADKYVPYSYSLSATIVKFVVQVLAPANLITPEFVQPTAEKNHMFIMYAHTTLRTNLYADAPEKYIIDSFTTLGIKGEQFKVSPLQQHPSRPQVKYTAMTWTPSADEIGSHIACAYARDDIGADAERCFILDVKADVFNHTTKVLPGKPYFVDIPSPDQFVHCKLDATCVVALYIKSTIEIEDVNITESFVDKYELGPIQSVKHNGETMYQTDLSFEHSMHGKERICFMAKDKNGIESENVCIQTKITPPDPCVSTPCRNAGTCVMDEDTGGFTCHCRPFFSGKACGIKEDRCTPDPCVQENSVLCVGMSSVLCYCKPGFSGDTCGINIDDCQDDSCNGHGICKDKVNAFDCECFSRYNGTNCEIDRCPAESPGIKSCTGGGPGAAVIG